MQCGAATATPPEEDASRAIEPLSKRWFGVDFRALLPWDLDPFSVTWGSLDTLVAFMTRHHADLFGSDAIAGRWHADPMTPAKARFLAETDIFLVRDGDAVIGHLIGHPSDWSTYYLRSTALLPEHRGNTIPILIKRITEILRSAGVERMELDATPTNGPTNIIMQSRQGYVATGTLNTDRWGTLVRLTKFLNVDAEGVFHDQFCAGTWPRRRRSITMGSEGRTS